MPRVPGHPSAAVEIARNKLLTRERLRDTDLPVPWFFPTSLAADPAALSAMVAFPCMIKPLVPTGGRGVARVDDAASFVRAFNDLRTILLSPEFAAEPEEDRTAVIVEGFVDGLEFVMAGMMEHGAFKVSALFDVDAGSTPTRSQAPDEMWRDIADAVSRATAAMGLRHGPLYAQCVITDGGVYVLGVSLDRWRRLEG